LLCSVKASYHGSEVPQLTEPSKKPTPQSVFLYPQKDTPYQLATQPQGTEEDMATPCTCCGKPLNKALRSADGLLKSCPRCSNTHGSLHVFRPYPEFFGTTPARVTASNVDGSQSHCIDCRGEGPGQPSHVDLSQQILCNQVRQA
jgi:hypothetical protein